jgi:hypothetical protein
MLVLHMNERLKLTIYSIAAAAIILNISGCMLPSKDHPDGIAYIRCWMPYIRTEVDNAPFTVRGHIKSANMVNMPIGVFILNRDSLSVALYISPRKNFYYRIKPGDKIENEYFSIMINMREHFGEKDFHHLFNFKFLDYKHVVHDGGIGYYKVGPTKSSFTDIGDLCPFKVEGEVLKRDIIDTPVYVKILKPDRIYLGFKKDGREYEQRSSSGNLFGIGCFSAKITVKDGLTAEDLAGLYFFKFER